MLSLWKGFLNLVFPPEPECPFCGEPDRQAKLCARCLAVIEEYRKEPYCCRCGRLAGKGAVFAGQMCADCRKKKWPFVKARAVGPYEGPLKDVIHRFKYAGKIGLSRCLAELMAGLVLNEPEFAEVDLLVPVPLSAAKLRQRKFNQAELLAREVGEIVGVPFEARSLVKKVETLPQAGLSRPARESNIRQAFQVTNKSRIEDRKILVIDDVFTTGSTVSAAASALARSGAGNVYCLTAATGRYF